MDTKIISVAKQDFWPLQTLSHDSKRESNGSSLLLFAIYNVITNRCDSALRPLSLKWKAVYFHSQALGIFFFNSSKLKRQRPWFGHVITKGPVRCLISGLNNLLKCNCLKMVREHTVQIPCKICAAIETEPLLTWVWLYHKTSWPGADKKTLSEGTRYVADNQIYSTSISLIGCCLRRWSLPSALILQFI